MHRIHMRLISQFEPKVFPPPKHWLDDSHDVGAYSGVFNISPHLQKLLERASRQRAFVNSVSKANSINKEKTWFNCTWLPNFMGSKTMTTSKTNLVQLPSNGNNNLPTNGTSRGGSHCDDCTDEEEEYSKPYWNKAYLPHSRHNLKGMMHV